MIARQNATMRIGNKLKTCLAFGKSEPHYAYKRNAYKRNKNKQMCNMFKKN